MTSHAYGARSPRSHYDVILIVTSFTTELAMPIIADKRMDTLPRLVYKDEWRRITIISGPRGAMSSYKKKKKTLHC